MTKLKRNLLLIFLLPIIILTIILIYFSLTQKTSPTTPVISPTITPVPTIATDITPQLVDFTEVSNQPLPTTINNYSASVADLTPIAFKIATALKFTGKGKNFDNGDNPFTTWTNQDHALTVSSHQIFYTNLSSSFISTISGNFSKTPDILTVEAQSLLKKLNIFDPQLVFQPTDYYYSQALENNSLPSPITQANLVTIILSPTIDTKAIFLKSNPIAQFTYDSAGQLVKFSVTNPISLIKSTDSSPTLTIDTIHSLPTSSFLLISYLTLDPGAIYDTPQFSQITPDSLSLGYLLDQGKLTPIYILSKSTSDFSTYRFATFATNSK